MLYGKTTSKKHQTWDGDGFLEVTGKNAVLKVTNQSVVNFALREIVLIFLIEYIL